MRSVNSSHQFQTSISPFQFVAPAPRIDGKRIFVTGATGFIGRRLLPRLVSRECQVLGSTRSNPLPSSQKVQWIQSNLGVDQLSLREKIEGCDYVFHLAAATRSARSADLVAQNTSSFRAVLEACAAIRRPPKLVFVSSLAACGPCVGDQLHTEDVKKRLISFYGKSKAACEDLAFEYAEQIPISIVRPPIVLGPGDRNGFKLFQSIKRWRCHLVPGYSNHLFSLIHVDDLVSALIRVAELGRRISPDSASQGVYFATSDCVLTYAGLGRQIGFAVGHDKIKFLRIPKWLMRFAGSMNELVGQATGKSKFLNRDKCREGTAGSWACSGEKLRTETGFRVEATLESRLKETANWYQTEGWL